MAPRATAATAAAAARGFTLLEVMITVAVIGVLAVIAVPAYNRYIRRSRTVEALTNLRKLYDSSVAYYTTEHADVDQQILKRQFPESIGDTPGTNPCCGQPGDRCDPAKSAAAWKAPTWSALNFAMTDPFVFWYRYDSLGGDDAANFSAWAFGNQDCDKIYSTFLRGGHVDELNNVAGGGAGLYLRHESE